MMKQQHPIVQHNVLLAPYTTMQIGGPARYLYPWNGGVQALRDTLQAARHNDVSFFILAGGSNVLFSDEGYPGLVVVVETSDFLVADERVEADAGVAMQTLVDATIEQGLQGLEWAGGLPGSLGGAVRGNAGAFGGEMKDSVVWVEALSLNDWTTKRFTNEECQFLYRESFFKDNPGWLIVRACLQCSLGDRNTLRAEAEDHIRYRQNNHPQEPNAGSMFKNIVVNDPSDLSEALRDVESVQKYGKLAAGVVIDRCGLKGRRRGNAQISEKHANHIINLGGARAADVLGLVQEAENAVREQFGIDLQREVHVVTPQGQ